MWMEAAPFALAGAIITIIDVVIDLPGRASRRHLRPSRSIFPPAQSKIRPANQFDHSGRFLLAFLQQAKPQQTFGGRDHRFLA
jgi:hypothetical protein